MTANRLLVVLFMAVSIVSCKKDEPKPAEAPKAAPAFTFTLNAIVKKNDSFQIFYKESMDQPAYQEDKSVWADVKGSETAQDITFTLPEDVFPVQLRFDFGANKEQSEVTVNSFKGSYGDKSFTVNGKDFFNYFAPDENFAKIDAATGKVIPFVTKDGNYDPMLFSLQPITDELKKLGGE